jgi:hypothetical protein
MKYKQCFSQLNIRFLIDLKLKIKKTKTKILITLCFLVSINKWQEISLITKENKVRFKNKF